MVSSNDAKYNNAAIMRTFELFHVALLCNMFTAMDDHEGSAMPIKTLAKSLFSIKLVSYFGFQDVTPWHILVPPPAMDCEHLCCLLSIHVAGK